MPVGWPPSAGLSVIFMDADLWSVSGQKSPPYLFSRGFLPVNRMSFCSPFGREGNLRCACEALNGSYRSEGRGLLACYSSLYGFGRNVSSFCSQSGEKHRHELLRPSKWLFHFLKRSCSPAPCQAVWRVTTMATHSHQPIGSDAWWRADPPVWWS